MKDIDFQRNEITVHDGKGARVQVQNAMAAGVRRARLSKPATPHTLAHSIATELICDGYDIRTDPFPAVSQRGPR